jgi:hypothetical protein
LDLISITKIALQQNCWGAIFWLNQLKILNIFSMRIGACEDWKLTLVFDLSLKKIVTKRSQMEIAEELWVI